MDAKVKYFEVNSTQDFRIKVAGGRGWVCARHFTVVYRNVANTSLSRVQACCECKPVANTSLSRIQFCREYKPVANTSLSRIQACREYKPVANTS